MAASAQSSILDEAPAPTRDRAEALSQSYLAIAHGNPADALRLLALHALEEQAEFDRAFAWGVSRGYVRADIGRVAAAGA